MPDNKKPEQRPSVDSLLSAPATTQEARASVPEDSRKKMKSALLVLVSVPYIAYLGWCFFLISIFPNTSDKFDVLLKPGVMSAVGGIVVLLLFALLFIKRLFRKGVDSNRRIMGSLRVLGFVAPGIIISMLVPVLTMKEPPLVVNIVDPVDQSQMVAPLSITFSVASAAEVLNKRGIGVREYSWDFDSDGEENDRTTVPEATAIFDRQGVYVVSVVMELNNGGIRAINRQIVIPQEVFSYSPMHPGVDEPIKFSVESLVDDLGLIREVQWDFDDDGIMDSVSDLPDAVHTYLRTGKVKVIAIVKLDNQTQKKYEREIEIFEPQPPPFPVEIKTEPDNLVGPAPFGTIFKVESEVPVGDVIWDFGDGTKKKRGERVGHTFHKRGTYQVTVRVHAEDGGIAELNTAVRIVDPLVLKDLKFDGKPKVKQNRIKGEVPLTVNIAARTSTPLIEFRWEAPGATSVGSLENELQAIYRRPGHYDITLIAEDPEGKVLRHPITLSVDPPASEVTIHMSPEGGTAPLLVRFDASETIIRDEEISGFEWVFGDEDAISSGPQQRGALVEHLFEEPGTFKVKLTAYTTSGKQFDAERTIVIRAPVLDACAFPSRTSGKAPLGVSFDMSCTTGNPISIEWDFGDGAQSDEKNPIHVFEEPGTYRVKLSIEDAVGTGSEKVITITAE